MVKILESVIFRIKRMVPSFPIGIKYLFYFSPFLKFILFEFKRGDGIGLEMMVNPW